jgi:hypothetical protein
MHQTRPHPRPDEESQAPDVRLLTKEEDVGGRLELLICEVAGVQRAGQRLRRSTECHVRRIGTQCALSVLDQGRFEHDVERQVLLRLRVDLDVVRFDQHNGSFDLDVGQVDPQIAPVDEHILRAELLLPSLEVLGEEVLVLNSR